MKQTVDNSIFRSAFHDMGRGDQFSYEALDLLFDYFEEIDEDMELDVIAICCDFAESSAEEIAQDYSIDIEGLDEDEIIETVREYLEDNTSIVGETSSGFVYQSF